MNDNLTWTFLQINWPELEQFTNILLDQVRRTSPEHWFFDSYRGCSMLPLLTPHGYSQKDQLQRNTEDLCWTNPAKEMTILPEVFSLLKPHFFPMGRLFVLKTEPGTNLNIHIDCSPEKINHADYKFRWVLGGETKGLYFLDKDREKKFPNESGASIYMMDGRHPHALDNSFASSTKYTLCLGSPWTYNKTQMQNFVQQRGAQKVSISMPTIDSNWFNPRYKIENKDVVIPAEHAY